jgi:ArsR family transcriptional regulator
MTKMSVKTAEKVSQVLKALAHPVRLRIVELLENEEKCVGEIMEGVEGKQSITSQQLNMMKDKGVLTCRRDGPKMFYRIANPNVIKLLHCIYNNCENE